MNRTTAPFALLFTLLSCQTTELPELRRWGTVHEALGGGQTQARVALRDVAISGFWGVGAMAELQGEVTIADGEVWTSTGGKGEGYPVTAHGPDPQAAATILFGSAVHRWHRIEVGRDVANAEIEAYVTELARQHGVDSEQAFVFRVEGPFRDLTLHVIAGQCPIRARMLGEKLRSPPYRATLAQTDGTLVGVFARGGGGVFAHHGNSLHLHVILRDPAITGHVESVGLRRGTTLYLPRSR